MGVVRTYKSTGDVQRVEREVVSKEEVYACHKKLDDGDDDDDNDNHDEVEEPDEEDMELARVQPLLSSHRAKSLSGAKWHSCKLLGNDRAYGEYEDYDEIERQHQQQQVDGSRGTDFAAKRWNHCKSASDFLALIAMQQQQQQFQQGQQQQQVSQVKVKQPHVSYDVCSFPTEAAAAAAAATTTTTTTIKSKVKSQGTASKASGSRRTNGAKRTLRRIKNHQVSKQQQQMLAVNLSLSSPSLAQQQHQQVVVRAELDEQAGLACVLDQQQRQEQQDADNRAGQRQQVAPVPAAAACVSADVHAWNKTKPNTADCCTIVDVAQLQQHRPSQQASDDKGTNHADDELHYSTASYMKPADLVQRLNSNSIGTANDNGFTCVELGVGGQQPLYLCADSHQATNRLASSLPAIQQQRKQQQQLQVVTGGKMQTTGGVGDKQQQQPEFVVESVGLDDNNCKHYYNPYESGKETSTTSKLRVDLNNAANRLMGTCCNSWRHALHPTHSGSYKVAQQHQELAANCEQHTSVSGQEICQHCNEEAGTRSSRQIARFSRPGRSPISLQSQTNARLTRHKLKIKQQRQEQLTQLALREREQLNQHVQPNHYQNHHHSHNRESSSSPAVEPRSIEVAARSNLEQEANDHLSLSLISSLLRRLSFNKSTPNNSRYQQSRQLNSNAQGSSLTARTTPRGLHEPREQLINHQHRNYRLDNLEISQQHQVINPSTRAIEICDNQLASTSRQELQHQQHQHLAAGSCSSHAGQTGAGGLNVIVYRSANMLRNASNEADSQQQQQYSGGRYKQSTGRNGLTAHDEKEEIESDSDSQTIRSDGSSTWSLSKPFCKICHMGNTKNGDKLISPCRCSGTMQYIHCGCLLKWLEISNRTNEKPMSCELCAHEYTWHKRFNYRRIQLPKCSPKDVILHLIFVAAIGVMLVTALAPMLRSKPTVDSVSVVAAPPTTAAVGGSKIEQQQAALAAAFRQRANGSDFEPSRFRYQPSSPFYHSLVLAGGSQGNQVQPTGRLAQDEKYMLICAASFFVSFFLAIYVQTKARDTLYGLVVKFLNMNQTYYITEYDHGQLNGNNNSHMNNSSNNNQHQDQQQQDQQRLQHQQYDGLRTDRKSSQKS